MVVFIYSDSVNVNVIIVGRLYISFDYYTRCNQGWIKSVHTSLTHNISSIFFGETYLFKKINRLFMVFFFLLQLLENIFYVYKIKQCLIE